MATSQTNQAELIRYRLWQRLDKPLIVILACLPLTHAPTIDLLFRLRISELLVWAYALPVLTRRWYWSRLTAFFFGALWSYTIYTGLVGIVQGFTIEVEVEAALLGTYHPVLRALLETARLSGGVLLGVWVVSRVRSRDDLLRVVTGFGIGGIILAAYVMYEVMVFFGGMPLPILPGSRSIPGFPVAATMYEPSAVGSFGAAVASLAFGVLGERRFRLGLAMLCAGLISVLLSTSRTGLVMLVSVVMIWMVLTLRYNLRRLIGGLLALGVTGYVTFIYAEKLLGDFFYKRFNMYSFMYYLQVRQEETYSQVIPSLAKLPWGYGEGLWLYAVGGGNGFGRLLAEGSLPGVIFLVAALMALSICMFQLVRSNLKSLEMGIIGASIGTIVGLYNYVNITDLWLWFVFALPFAAWRIRKQELRGLRYVKSPSPH